MYNITIKIPQVVKEKLQAYSVNKGVSKSEIVRTALLEYLEKEDFRFEGSFLDIAGDFAGSEEGPEDLSTNKKYLDDLGK